MNATQISLTMQQLKAAGSAQEQHVSWQPGNVAAKSSVSTRAQIAPQALAERLMAVTPTSSLGSDDEFGHSSGFIDTSSDSVTSVS